MYKMIIRVKSVFGEGRTVMKFDDVNKALDYMKYGLFHGDVNYIVTDDTSELYRIVGNIADTAFAVSIVKESEPPKELGE